MITIIKYYKNLSFKDKIKFSRIVAERKSKSFVTYIYARSFKIPYWQDLASQARRNHLFEKKLLQEL